VRSELRDVLARSSVERELLALEPLLDDYDGVEVAAAALKLLEQERENARESARESARERDRSAVPARSADTPAAISRSRDSAAMTRLFVSVGSRDNARPGDLMGAIANQAGLSSTDVGKIDIRESHSIVEVAAGVADTVIERVSGTSIRGRRAIVRRDEERPPRSPDRGPRGPGRGPRGPRGPGRGPRREARE